MKNKQALEIVPKLSILLDKFYVEIVYFVALFTWAIKSSLSHKIILKNSKSALGAKV